MASLIIFLGILIGLIATGGYFYAHDELMTAHRVAAQSDVDLEIENYVRVYQGLLRNTLDTEKITSTVMAAGLRCKIHKECTSYDLFGNPASLPAWVKKLSSPYGVGNTTDDVMAKVVAVSPKTSPQQFLSVLIYKDPKGSKKRFDSRTVSFQLGQVAVFKNALTGNSFKCIFCHATIMGDVANYMPIEINGPRSTALHGRLILGSGTPLRDDDLQKFISPPNSSRYVLSDYPHPFTDQFDAHYIGRTQSTSATPYRAGNEWVASSADVTSRFFMFGIMENYMGPGLPWNYVRKKMMLPKIDPKMMETYARGSVKGRMVQVKLGDTYGPGSHPFAVKELKNATGTHVILDGRVSPIVISGQVFVKGDLIILGRVSGKGELYSGRNIYIPDDLTYANPPPQFDGKEASNKIMHMVSLQPESIAASMKKYDRLGLFATNNIIIGSPFSATPGQLDSDNVFMNYTSLMKYSSSRELAYDPQNGQMYDREIIDPDRVCYLKPWESMDDCIVISGDYPDSNPKVVVTPIMDAHVRPKVTPKHDRHHYLEWTRPMLPSANYKINFLPNSFGAKVKPWISEANYHGIFDSSDKKGLISVDVYGRKKRVFEGSVAIPGLNPYSSKSINANAIIDTLETEFGAMSSLGSIKSKLGDPTAPGGGYLIADMFKKFLKECEKSATGNGTADYPKTGFEGRNQSNFRESTDFPIIKDGVTRTDAKEGEVSYGTPLYYDAIRCDFAFNPEIDFPDGSRGEMVASIHHFGRSKLLQSGHETQRGVVFCKTWGEETGTLAGSKKPPCVTRADGTPFVFSDGEEYGLKRADGSFSFVLEAGLNLRDFRIKLTTRYYDPVKVKYRNRVDKIQALLFANQFVSYSHYSSFDRQLRLHGGVVSKDLLGRFVSVAGPETKRVANNYLNPRYNSAAETHTQIGLFPSLWVIQDPRFQYTTEVIGRDLLTVAEIE